MLINDRSFFEENFKNTETFKHESSIRNSDILAFSETMNGYFNIVVNEAWVHWNKEMQAHTDWYKNDDPIAYKWAKAGSPEYEADFYTSAKAWAAAKAHAVPIWISPNFMLPDAGELVLGLSTTKLAKFNVYQVVALDEFKECDINYWIPLPKAPNELGATE
ncbi:hypothetical protein [Acinetobacter lactucae]|uniref:hypothetical protein n=1 Tax=Acinetobacter lactucae TaxID=1785128 RepID=UPI00237B6504|nr:hypothetical protein [Acinetobacter lactucae]MDD9317913.1 hypothetical protein [Acinetobacter lactucae]